MNIVYTYSMDVAAWLARVRHDLIKRVLWPARDRRDLGGPVCEGELVAQLIDDEGRPFSASALWRALLADAPATLSNESARDFAAALDAACAGALADQLEPVLALEAAFAELAQRVKGR